MSVLTLFSDASFDIGSGAGGWGAWAKHSSWPAGVLFSGPMKLLKGSSADAEITAIFAALQHLPKLGGFDNIRTVVIQSDCLRALGLIAAWIPGCRVLSEKNTAEIHVLKGKLTEYEGRAIVALRSLAKKYALAFQLSHVRAHTSGPGSSPMNRECDKLARSVMKEHKKLLAPPGRTPSLPSNHDASGVLEMMKRVFGAEIGREVKVASAGGQQPPQVKSVSGKSVSGKRREQKKRAKAKAAVAVASRAVAPATKGSPVARLSRSARARMRQKEAIAFCDLPESARIAKTRRNKELEQSAFTLKRALL